jgi:hypothetical protein
VAYEQVAFLWHAVLCREDMDLEKAVNKGFDAETGDYEVLFRVPLSACEIYI